ncbi:MAG: PRD domain-containing protein [Breznakia sp.]
MKEKLEIIKEAEIISENTYQKMKTIINHFYKVYEFVGKNKVDTFLLHLCMAIQRQEDEKEIIELGKEVESEIRNSNCYTDAKKILEELEKHYDFYLSYAEKLYCLIHIINILN